MIFPNFFCLRDFRVFYRQKSVGPIGPTPQGRGLIDIILGFLMGFLKFLSNPHYTFSLKEGFVLAPAIF
jgi:hypothetical protein